MPFVGIGTLPTPFSPASVPLPPETGGRGHTSLRVGGGGLGGVPIPTRGIHCGTLYMCFVGGVIWFGYIARLSQWEEGLFYSFEWFLPAFTALGGREGWGRNPVDLNTVNVSPNLCFIEEKFFFLKFSPLVEVKITLRSNGKTMLGGISLKMKNTLNVYLYSKSIQSFFNGYCTVQELYVDQKFPWLWEEFF